MVKNYFIAIKKPRNAKHFGHFLRDFCLHVFYQLYTKGALNKDYKLFVHMRGMAKLTGENIHFLKTVFKNVQVLYQKQGHLINNQLNVEHLSPHGFGGDDIDFPKLIINEFRDLCLKQFKIDTTLKNQILFAPRSPSTRRHIPKCDPVIGELEKICAEKNYKLIIWDDGNAAHTSENTWEEQMSAYAQSKIIIGAAGANFANTYWTNEHQLIMEITGGHHSGHSAAFYSEEIKERMEKKWGSHAKTWNTSDKLELTLIDDDGKKTTLCHKSPAVRQWYYIDTPEENITVTRSGFDAAPFTEAQVLVNQVYFWTSQENRDKIIKLINDFIV